MKTVNFRTCIPAFLLVGMMLVSACNNNGGSYNASLNNNIDSVSYSFGFQNGKMLKQRSMTDIKPNKMIAGMKAALNGDSSKISQSDMRQVVQAYAMQSRQRSQKKRKKEGMKNKKAGQKFLVNNKDKDGIKTTDDGLQYKILTKGSGVSPDSTDTVKVNYELSDIDGNVLQSSYKKGQPVTFPLNRVVPGWSEGVQMMKEGGEYKFFIPGDLGYGQRGRGEDIGPNQTLVFKVKLLKVNPPKPKTQGARPQPRQ